MKILILGCGGFIGSHLVKSLLERDYNVYGVDLIKYKIEQHLNNEKFNFIVADVYESPKVEQLIAKADAVILLSTLCNPALYVSNPLEVIKSNFISPMKIVDLCAKYNKWLINFSSCEIYGRTISSHVSASYDNIDLYKQIEDTTPFVLGPVHKQRWCYSSAKQLLERYIYAYHTNKNYEMPFTTIRPYNFIGPRLDYINELDGAGIPRVLACFIGAILKKEPIKVVDGGEVYRVFTYINDAIDAIITIIENRSKCVGQIFNIANPNNETTIKNLADIIKVTFSEIKKDAGYLDHPVEVIKSDDFYGNGYEDCDRRVPDIQKIASLGWQPKFNLESTIYHTVQGFINNYVTSIRSI